jgi:hypothetical protein
MDGHDYQRPSLPPPTLGDILLQLFSNGRFYILLFVITCLICTTVLAALKDINSQAATAILAALIGAAIGHANGALQGAQQAYIRANGLPPIPKDKPRE